MKGKNSPSVSRRRCWPSKRRATTPVGSGSRPCPARPRPLPNASLAPFDTFWAST